MSETVTIILTIIGTGASVLAVTVAMMFHMLKRMDGMEHRMGSMEHRLNARIDSLFNRLQPTNQ